MSFFNKTLEIEPKTFLKTPPDEAFHALHDIHARQKWLEARGLTHPEASVFGRETETDVGRKRLYQIHHAIFPIILEETVEAFDPDARRFASYIERADEAGMNFHVELEVSPSGEQDGSAIEMHIEAVGVKGLLGVFAKPRMEREAQRRLARIDGPEVSATQPSVEPLLA